jgi:hypothetical protein
LFASFDREPHQLHWRRVVSVARPLNDVTSTKAELQGACEAINVALAYVKGQLGADDLAI